MFLIIGTTPVKRTAPTSMPRCKDIPYGNAVKNSAALIVAWSLS